jgi:hypothetical protein
MFRLSIQSQVAGFNLWCSREVRRSLSSNSFRSENWLSACRPFTFGRPVASETVLTLFSLVLPFFAENRQRGRGLAQEASPPVGDAPKAKVIPILDDLTPREAQS